MRILLAAAFGILATAATPAAAAPCTAPDNRTLVTGKSECLLIRTFPASGGGEAATLMVLLHGNHSDGSPATSMFGVAEKLAEQAGPATVAVAMIRPGYNDDQGNRSSGDDYQRADNFVAENIDIVAAAIGTLKTVHKAKRVVLVGHSGGAATAGVILGRHPGLAAAALLVSCPCNVPAWRLGRHGPSWQSESPDRYVDRIPAGTKVTVLVSKDDAVTKPELSQDYVEMLTAKGLPADLVIVEGMGHTRIVRSPDLIRAALAVIATE